MAKSLSSRVQQLHLVSLILLLSSIVAARAQCTRNSVKKDLIPTFLCQVNVTVTQTGSCTTAITETFVLPHTNGSSFGRELFMFKGEQKASAIAATVDKLSATLTRSYTTDRVLIKIK
eukprot:IDg4450t1